MKIVVTGACGGIGTHLVPKLLESGHEVIAIDDLSSGSWEDLAIHPHLTLLTVDISDSASLSSSLQMFEFNFIYHLAAISSLPECQIDPARAMSVNFIGTINLVEIAKREKDFIGFVFASTSAVYEASKPLPYFEDCEIMPSLVYPVSKYHSENYLLTQFVHYSFPSTILRFFNIFGDFQNSRRKSPPLLNYIVRELLDGNSPTLHSDGDQERDFISVDDVVNAMLVFVNIERHCAEIFNVCTGRLLKVNQMLVNANLALGTDIAAHYAKPEEFWNAYPELFNSDFPLDLTVVVNEVNKASLGSNAKLTNFLGWQPGKDVESQIQDISIRIKNRMLK